MRDEVVRPTLHISEPEACLYGAMETQGPAVAKIHSVTLLHFMRLSYVFLADDYRVVFLRPSVATTPWLAVIVQHVSLLWATATEGKQIVRNRYLQERLPGMETK